MITPIVSHWKCHWQSNDGSAGFILEVPDDIFTKKELQSWTPDHISQSGQDFFIEAVRTVDGNWIFWIYFLGSENKAKNYFYTITICNSDKSLKSSYSGQVTSMRQESGSSRRSQGSKWTPS
jgi:hypothetical protein